MVYLINGQSVKKCIETCFINVLTYKMDLLKYAETSVEQRLHTFHKRSAVGFSVYE